MDYEDDYSENAHCDNTGYCIGFRCSHFPVCAGWVKGKKNSEEKTNDKSNDKRTGT